MNRAVLVLFQAHNRLVNLLEEADIDVIQMESFADDPKPAIMNLKVIMLNYYNVTYCKVRNISEIKFT